MNLEGNTIWIELGALGVIFLLLVLGLWRSYRVLKLTPRVFITGIILALVLLFGTVQGMVTGFIAYLDPLLARSMGADSLKEPISLFSNTTFWLGFFKILLGLASVFSIISYLSPKGHSGEGAAAGNGVLVQNFFTILFVVAAVYFSIAAMIAVPLVKGDKVFNAVQYRDSLQHNFNLVSNTDGTLRAGYLKTLDSISTDGELTDDKHQLMELIKDRTKREVDLIFNELVPDMKRQALSQMESSDLANLVNSLKLKEKAQLLEWFQLNRRDLIIYLNDEIREVKEFTYTIYFSDMDTDLLLNDFNGLPNVRPEISDLPISPRQGDYLGIFNVAMRWLLEIESYPLVMIFGMAGFGLLGAASGAFIKEGMRRKEKGGPLVEDLPGVMIKGFTASMVVFLGIQGSLGILGGGTTEQLDSNLLFFLALVAAVYSDKAWEWAGDKFEETLNKDKEGNEDAPPAGPGNPDFMAGPPLPEADAPSFGTATTVMGSNPPTGGVPPTTTTSNPLAAGPPPA
ncbi:MAG TPA: hypothetical protein DCR93_19255, partial [Cytophagales bacterium]|nr:hypothetical protein [Cytophagales bacterium]